MNKRWSKESKRNEEGGKKKKKEIQWMNGMNEYVYGVK
jgi:hypothetical protein